jgi:hypothetical protein
MTTKKTKKAIKARDLKPRKDAQGGFASRIYNPSQSSRKLIAER